MTDALKSLRNVVIASNRVHAKAIIRWANMEADDWDVLLYGDEVPTHVGDVLLVRPVGEVTPDHVFWVKNELRPAIRGSLASAAGWFPTVASPQLIEQQTA